MGEHVETVKRLKAEIERLTKLSETWKGVAMCQEAIAEVAEAEVERLRGAHMAIERTCIDTSAPYEDAIETIGALARAALEAKQ